MPSRLRGLAFRLLLLASSLLLGLAIGEVAVRALKPQAVLVITPGLYQADPPRRYRLAPGHRGTITNRVEFSTAVRVNRAGLRGPEVGPKREGVLRILAAGDSFTFASTVEEAEAWIALLGEQLGGHGIPAEGLNGGVNGYGVPDATAWVAAHGVPLEPDLVVLGVFVGNDLQDANPGLAQAEVVDGLLEAPTSRGGWKRWLYYHSHLFVLAKRGLPYPIQSRLRGLLGLAEPWDLTVRRQEAAVYRRADSEAVRLGAEATDRALEQLQQLAEQRGIRLAALLIPAPAQVDPAAWQSLFAELGLDPSGHDPDRPTAIFRDLLARRGIPALDLTGALREEREQRAFLYYPIDQHLTPEGNRVAARELARFLLDSGLAAPPRPGS